MTGAADIRDFLLRGGWFALEQAARLVNDARMLFEGGSHSTAAGLALLSREELAKSRKLFALWMRANRGEQVTRDDVMRNIEVSHVEKQRHGASMFSIRVDKSTLEALTRGREGGPEKYQEARQRVDATLQRVMKRAPDSRHRLRLRAFYVDAAQDDDTWLRPGDISAAEAEDVLVDAGNDYWQHRNPGMPAPSSDIDALNAALAAWMDKPPLPPAEFR